MRTAPAACGTAVAAVIAAVFTAVPASAAPAASAHTAAGRTAAASASDLAALVNPFIGTAGRGDVFPGADTPFGMLQWSPDTAIRPDGGGYSSGSSKITGFSLVHMSGPGCRFGGDVPVLPSLGAVRPAADEEFRRSRQEAPGRLLLRPPRRRDRRPPHRHDPDRACSIQLSGRPSRQPDLQAGRQPERR